MKPSHLAALCLAGLGVGGMSSAATSTPVVSKDAYLSQIKKNATAATSRAMEIALRLDMDKGGFPVTKHPCSWRKKNQRQIRKNRRRAFASGNHGAFA